MAKIGRSLPDSCHLTQYIGTETPSEYRIAVVNSDRPEAIDRLVEKLFAQQSVELTDEDVPEVEDAVVLLDDDEVVATTPIETLNDTILLVNSDLYITGAVDVEDIDLPDVIARLSETTFHVRGYPKSNTEKLPLILISRYIERLSYAHGGTHRASFQRLSRLQDEKGTRDVYDRLTAEGVNTHVYGVADWLPPEELDATVHAGHGPDFESTWFVIHQSDTAAAALVAIEVGPNEWLSRWTFVDKLVADIEATVTEYL